MGMKKIVYLSLALAVGCFSWGCGDSGGSSGGSASAVTDDSPLAQWIVGTWTCWLKEDDLDIAEDNWMLVFYPDGTYKEYMITLGWSAPGQWQVSGTLIITSGGWTNTYKIEGLETNMFLYYGGGGPWGKFKRK